MYESGAEFSPEMSLQGTPPNSAMGTNRGTSRRQLFQPLADVSNTASLQILEEVKKTNASLAVFSTRMDTLEDRMKKVETGLSATPSSSSSTYSGKKEKRKVPVRVRHEVREVYRALVDSDEFTAAGFDLKKRFTDVENQEVLARLCTDVKAVDSTIPPAKTLLRGSFKRRLEESLKKKGKYDEKVQRQRRQNRLKRKLDMRKSTLLKSAMIPEEQKTIAMEILKKEFMSSGESSVQNEDDGAERPVIVVKPLPWRGPKANRYLKRLDQKAVGKKSKQSLQQTFPRVVGHNSQRPKPVCFDDTFWGFIAQ